MIGVSSQGLSLSLSDPRELISLGPLTLLKETFSVCKITIFRDNIMLPKKDIRPDSAKIKGRFFIFRNYSANHQKADIYP